MAADLVSGDHGRVDYDETATMPLWLINQDVPIGKVVADNAKRLAGVDKVSDLARGEESDDR